MADYSAGFGGGVIMSTVNNSQAELIPSGAVTQIPVKRPCFILATCTIADCPIEAMCVSRPGEKERKVVCGYYMGAHSYGGGSQVVCGYTGERV